MAKGEISDKEIISYLQDTLYVINGKWKLPILIAIKEEVYVLEKFNGMFHLLPAGYYLLN